MFDRQVLDKVQLELNRQYLSHGKYGLKIKTDVAKLTRNRVGIHIKISEGRVTKIKQINIVGNTVYKKIVLDAQESVKGGGSISSALMRYSEIPPLFSSMVAIGERTGKMDFILEHISKFYKSESENSVQNISQIIEPVLIFILGIAVAGLVSSILLPIYNIVGGGF